MSDHPEIAARFARDTAGHELIVLRDDGLYRHLRFRAARSSEYWFELITWPGCLTIRGDYGNAYTFTREPDMFPFFRADRRWGVNPHYWSQKLDGHRQSAKTYSEATFRQIVGELFVDAVRGGYAPAGLGKAVRSEILALDLHDEREAREALDSFEYKDFRFEDTWEFSFQDYENDFLWACHAIVWGIARYDRMRKYGLQQLAVGDVVASAVAEGRCLKAPVGGCGKPLVAEDGSARVFWDEDEAARYEKEWRTTGLCPDCQDAAEAVAS
jgi:hypothetical protein